MRRSISNHQIHHRLSQRLMLPERDHISMIQLAKELQAFGIPARVDIASFELAGIDVDETCAWKNSPVSLSDSLIVNLRDLDLSYCIDHGFLILTTLEEAEQNCRPVIYDVTELVRADYRRSVGRLWRGEDFDFDTLIVTITSVVAPDTWEEVGGVGSIAGYPVNGRALLIFSQTEDVHVRVQKLLNRLSHMAGLAPPRISGSVEAVGRRDKAKSKLRQSNLPVAGRIR